MITRQIVAFDGGRAGLAPARIYKSASTAGGTSFTQPAIAVYPFIPATTAAAARAQHRRDRMIPARPGPAIRHQGEQFQQATTGARRWRRRHYRLTISKGNGRLNHGETPGRTRICRKNHVLPELRPITAATRYTGHIPSRAAGRLTIVILKQPC